MMPNTPRGLLFVIVGPGGSGKNTLMNTIMQRHPQIKQLATATTRPMRSNEQQGREHEFVTEERFREMIANDELLEHQEVTTGVFYGIIRASVENQLKSGQHLMADIEVYGAEILREKFPSDTVLIFVTVSGITLEEKLEKLRKRMLERIEKPTAEDTVRIQERIDRARELEFPYQKECEIVIVNDDKNRAVKELEQFVLSKIAERQAATEEA